MSRKALGGLLLACATCAAGAQAQNVTLELDPARTEINFTLPATLHTVHGAFRLRSGTVHYDPATGKAGGEVIVDVASGATGNGGRDRKMHKDVLESARFPEAVFTPASVEARLSPEGTSALQVRGMFQIHGTVHEVTLSGRVEIKDDQFTVLLHSELNYTQWGLKNPSTLFLRVGDTVQLEIRAIGRRNAHAGAGTVR